MSSGPESSAEMRRLSFVCIEIYVPALTAVGPRFRVLSTFVDVSLPCKYRDRPATTEFLVTRGHHTSVAESGCLLAVNVAFSELQVGRCRENNTLPPNHSVMLARHSALHHEVLLKFRIIVCSVSLCSV